MLFPKPLGHVVYPQEPSESSSGLLVWCFKMDCELKFDLFSKGHRKDSEKSRNRKDDDSLAEASHSKKTVKKAGNGVVPQTGTTLFLPTMAKPRTPPRCFVPSEPGSPQFHHKAALGIDLYLHGSILGPGERA